MSLSEVETVLAWHEALNAGDVARVLALSTDDVEVGGPRGSGRGTDLLREWFGRADIQLEPLRTVQENHVVVVEESARWAAHEGSATEPQVVASVFRVQDGKVESVLRYSDLRSAAEAAGLDPSLAVRC